MVVCADAHATREEALSALPRQAVLLLSGTKQEGGKRPRALTSRGGSSSSSSNSGIGSASAAEDAQDEVSRLALSWL